MWMVQYQNKCYILRYKKHKNKLRIQRNHWENTQNFILIAAWQPSETLAGKKKAEHVNFLTKT